MKLNISDELLLVYDVLPQEFRKEDILKRVNINPSTLGYQLKQMYKLGMIDKLSARKWVKRYASVVSWFGSYLRKKRKELNSKPNNKIKK